MCKNMIIILFSKLLNENIRVKYTIFYTKKSKIKNWVLNKSKVKCKI